MNLKDKQQINTQRAMLELSSPMDYELMMRYIDILCDRYKFLSMNYIGESIHGRGIPMLTLGNGKKQVVYAGAFSGVEHICATVLLRFINEYCEVKKSRGRIYNYSIDYLFATRRICVIPMLNADGVDICINGVSEDNVLKERLISMNGGARFTDWRANGRGVSLDRNFNSDFLKYRALSAEQGICSGSSVGFCGEYPESEPEVGALCSNIRFSGDVRAAISLRLGGERIYYRTEQGAPVMTKSIAKAISRASGYKLQDAEDNERAWGSFFGWCIDELKVPAFDICCGRENPKYPDTYFELYSRLRETLFTLPALI